MCSLFIRKLGSVVFFIGAVIVLANCRARSSQLSETAQSSEAVQWNRVELPTGATVRLVSPNLSWIIYTRDSLGTPQPANEAGFWLGKIGEGGNLASSIPIFNLGDQYRSYPLAFSPDSSTFVIESYDEQFAHGEIWLVSVANLQNRWLVYTGDSPLHGVRWAPDSQQLAIYTKDWGADLVSINGVVKKGIVPPDSFAKTAGSLSWSPSSDQIAYSDVHEIPVKVWITDLDSGNRHLLISYSWPVEPIWSPRRDSISLLEMENTEQDIKAQFTILNVSDGQIRATVDLPVWPTPGEGMWSPDGTRFAVTLEERGQTYIGLVIFPNGKLSQIPINGRNGRVFGWTPNSQAVIVGTAHDGTDILVRTSITP